MTGITSVLWRWPSSRPRVPGTVEGAEVGTVDTIVAVVGLILVGIHLVVPGGIGALAHRGVRD